MVKVITQETFDSVVLENVNEFEMSADEAREDAIKQFESQGVNLSNIVTSAAGDGRPVEKLSQYFIDRTGKEVGEECEELISRLKELEVECKKDLPHRVMAAKTGVYPSLIKLLDCSQPELVFQTLLTLLALTDQQPDLLDAPSAASLVKLLDQYIDSSDAPKLITVLKLIKNLCTLHELNRQLLIFEHELASRIRRILESPAAKDGQVVQYVCMLTRVVVADDDIRVEFGKAHEYACTIAQEHNGLPLLTNLLTEFQHDCKTVSEILLSLARLAVRNEFCQLVVEEGGLKFILDGLINFHENSQLVEQSLVLLKALGGNDDVKREVAKSGGIPLIVAAVTRHQVNPGVAEMGCAAMAVIALRMPDIAIELVQSGAAQVIVDILKIHVKQIKIERQAAMAIRNIVCRKKDELCSVFISLGVEDLLQKILLRQKSGTDEIKAALRDLGCKVKLTEQWTGHSGAVMQ